MVHAVSRAVAAAAAAVATMVALVAIPALPAEAASGTASPSRIESTVAPAAEVGGIDAAVYLPPGYDESDAAYPSLYLLHGRGDTLSAWQRVAGTLDALIADGSIPPMIVVMPDAPWNDRGSWYADSAYAGDAASGPGLPVETAIVEDLVAHVDGAYRTVADRGARAVGGYSMGGAGAVRLVLAHQAVFSAAIVLSPAVYVPQPPADSSARDYGAYGVGDALFDEERFTALSYPTALAAVDPSLPVHLFIAVGDDEHANPDPAEAIHDLTMEAASLYTAARRVPGVTAELRVLDGGHDWDVWEPAFAEGVQDVAARLRTSPPTAWEAELVGSSGDDRAGGIVATDDGGTIVALAAADAVAGGGAHVGGLDVVVQRRDAAGVVAWSTSLATSADERAYGLVPDGAGGVIVAGSTRGDLGGSGAPLERDDAFVAAIGPDGDVRWVTRLGAADAADRLYAVAADGAGGAVATGYTSGSVAQPSAGDKDVLVVHVDADGDVVMQAQVGSPGEDKAYGIAMTTDDAIAVAGVAGGALPGAASAGGGSDGFLLLLDADGTVRWVQQVGTPETDQLLGVVARTDGSLVGIGSTRGTLGASSSGDHDVVVLAVDGLGAGLWTTQVGTSGDDRGVAGVATDDGGVAVVAVTSGALGVPIGGVDVAVLPVDAEGTAGVATQVGSVRRDGSDEWDDANLLSVLDPLAARPTMLLTGLTYGAPAGATAIGSGDVFVMRMPLAAGVEPGAPVGPSPSAGAVGVPARGGSDAALPRLGASIALLALVLGALAAGAGAGLVGRSRRRLASTM